MFKAMSTDYKRRLIVSALSTFIAVPLVCVCVFIPAGVFLSTPNASVWTLIIPAGLLCLLIVVGPVVTLLLTMYQRKRWLDTILAPYGLQGQTYGLSGREYRGTVEGREVIVRFARGPAFSLYVSAPAQTRVAFSHAGMVMAPLAKAVNYHPLAFGAPELAAFSISALEDSWLRELLAVHEVRAALVRLMQAAESWALLQQVIISPNFVKLWLYKNKNLWRYDISPEEAQQWLSDLLLLARAIECVPSPRQPVTESSLETFVRRGGMDRWVWVVIIVLVVGMPLCGALVTLLVLALA